MPSKKLNPLFFSAFLFLVSPLFMYAQQGWQPVSSKVVNPYTSSNIRALAVSNANNKVYAGIGGTVYEWTGNGWQPLGGNPLLTAGSAGTVECIAADAAGAVYAGGTFTNSDGHYGVAKWNGSKWVEVGTGANSLNGTGYVSDIVFDGAGHIYACGAFRNGVAEHYVAKWDGTKWVELGAGLSRLAANDDINSITIDKAGNVYAAGAFTNAGGAPYVAKWNGSNWSEVGALGANASIKTLTTTPNGDVYAAGLFIKNGLPYVAKWNGNSWGALPVIPASNGISYIYKLVADSSGKLYARSNVTNSDGYMYVASWDGTAWGEVGTGANSLHPNNSINNIAVDKAGNVYGGGFFTDANSQCYIARFTKANGTWGRLGVDGSGELVAAQGELTGAVAGPNNIYVLNKAHVYHWNGFYWTTLPPLDKETVFSTLLTSVAVDKKGRAYVAGQQDGKVLFSRWDGTYWTALDTVGGFIDRIPASGGFYDLLADTLGNIYGRVHYTADSGYIAKWDGKAWGAIRYNFYSNNSYQAMSGIALDAGGNLYAGLHGQDEAGNDYNFVGKWNGSQWAEVGTRYSLGYSPDLISKIAIDKNGIIYANTGGDAQHIFSIAIKRFNGTNWEQVGTYGDFYEINAVKTDTAGNVYAAVYSKNFGFGVNIFKGNSWQELGTGAGALQANERPLWLGTDNKGNLYTMGAFTNTDGYNYVAKYTLGSLLPAGIQNFRGSVIKQNALLSWQTTTEINTQYFTVERSINGSGFAAVGKVAAAGSSATLTNYGFTNPLTGIAPTITKIYYRLAQVDNDGSITRSDIITLTLSGLPGKLSAAIYPMPVKGMLQLHLTNAIGKTGISIFTTDGKTVLASNTVGNYADIISINVASLKKGIYMLRVTNNGENKTLKFVKE